MSEIFWRPPDKSGKNILIDTMKTKETPENFKSWIEKIMGNGIKAAG